MTKAKKIFIVAVAAVSFLSTVSGMSASARRYTPTLTTRFLVGSTYATGTLFCDGSYASASTSLSGAKCSVTLSCGNATASRSNVRSSASVKIDSVTSTRASSTHSATLNGYSGSSSLTY